MKQRTGSHCYHRVEGQRSKGGDDIRLRGQRAPPEAEIVESHLVELWESRTYTDPLCLGTLPVKVTSSAI